jgi:hypothetical protein
VLAQAATRSGIYNPGNVHGMSPACSRRQTQRAWFDEVKQTGLQYESLYSGTNRFVKA